MIKLVEKKNNLDFWELEFYNSIDRLPLIIKSSNQSNYFKSFEFFDELENLISIKFDVYSKIIFEISFVNVKQQSVVYMKENFKANFNIKSLSDFCLMVEDDESKRVTLPIKYYVYENSILITFNSERFDLKEDYIFYKSSDRLLFGFDGKNITSIFLNKISNSEKEDFFYF